MAKNITFYRNKLKEKEQEIKILKEIAETISYDWNLKNILSAIIKIVSKYANSDSCFIYLVDNSTLTLQASQNPHQSELGKISMKKGEGITGWVARHKKTAIILSRAYEDERFKFFNKLPEDKYEAFLSFPIIFNDQIVGVINIQHKKKKVYKKEQISFLETVSKQVGGAIENARLINETDILKEALGTRKIIDRAKAILIKRYGMSEHEAHSAMTKKSMDSRKSLKEVAEAIILMEGMGKINYPS